MNGYTKLRKSKIFLTITVTLAITPATAWTGQAADPAESAKQQKELLPEVELLEFLGLFEDTESGWVDPMFLLENDIDESLEEKEKEEHDEFK